MSAVAKAKSEVIRAIPAACADEKAAVEFMERQRWGDDPRCPRCENRNVYQMKDRKTGDRQKDWRWRCRECGKHFTVRIGTVFEDSRISLRHWCFAFWRACTSKKGVAALEIRRQTGLSYKSALFMMHRIRWAMREDAPVLRGTVTVDETFVGGKPRYPGKIRPKSVVMAMIERDGPIVLQPVADVSAKSLKEAIRTHIAFDSRILSDENRSYMGIGKEYAGGHHTVNHKRLEYVRGDVSTNDAESFFAVLKRGVNGIYHSVSKRHLHRYLSEFQFRYNRRKLDDGERTVAAIQAAVGKRLVYLDPVRG